MKALRIGVLVSALFALGCGSVVLTPQPDRFSREDHRPMDPLDELAFARGYFARPDYEPAGAPYRTVMTYTKMMTRHDSITILLAQNRLTKQYFVIVFDLPNFKGWSRESLLARSGVNDALPGIPVQLTKP